jgi:hypothetical protein
MWAMWRDGTFYDPEGIRVDMAAGLATEAAYARARAVAMHVATKKMRRDQLRVKQPARLAAKRKAKK